jgi:uncharacterized protein YceH (UPF0502 family)
VQSTLERLANRGSDAPADNNAPRSESAASQPLVVMLPRQPGSRESRYAHLLGGPIAASGPARSVTAATLVEATHRDSAARDHARLHPDLAARLHVLEETVLQLQTRVDALESAEQRPAPPSGPPYP